MKEAPTRTFHRRRMQPSHIYRNDFFPYDFADLKTLMSLPLLILEVWRLGVQVRGSGCASSSYHLLKGVSNPSRFRYVHWQRSSLADLVPLCPCLRSQHRPLFTTTSCPTISLNVAHFLAVFASNSTRGHPPLWFRFAFPLHLRG